MHYAWRWPMVPIEIVDVVTTFLFCLISSTKIVSASNVFTRTSRRRMPNPVRDLSIGRECDRHQAVRSNHRPMPSVLSRERWLHPLHPLWKGGVWVGEHLRPLLLLLLHQPLHRLHQRGHHQALPSLQQSCGRGQDRGQQPARVLAKGGGDGYSYGFPGVVVVAVN